VCVCVGGGEIERVCVFVSESVCARVCAACPMKSSIGDLIVHQRC
jgi:hypothetical protein